MRASDKTFGSARKLRRHMSLPEIVLWQALRKRGQSGLRFRRQHPLGPYILDFYCPAVRLAVEVMDAYTIAPPRQITMSAVRHGSANKE